MRPNFKSRKRGQAMVEFALVVPVLITMLLFSMYFTEVMRAKLRLQEASRFLAWEMTSFVLTDYSNSNANKNQSAFNVAKQEALTDALARFQDLESIDNQSPSNMALTIRNVTATVKDVPVNMVNNPIPTSGSNPGGPLIGGVLNAANGGLNAFFNRFGFNTSGKVEVEFSATVDSRFLPQNFLNDPNGFYTVDQWGGTSLQGKVLKNKFTLVADGWMLPDGSDALMTINGGQGGPRAGVHNGGSPHGIYLQVKRMQALGVAATLASIPGLGKITNILAFIGVPDPFTSSFAVAHNYGLPGGVPQTQNNCNQDPGHTAPAGMNNLETASKLDYKRRKCYDTVPFRDQAAYGGGPGTGSEYGQMFQARGDFFMGCKRAMADDPAANNVANSTTIALDRNNQKIGCEQ